MINFIKNNRSHLIIFLGICALIITLIKMPKDFKNIFNCDTSTLKKIEVGYIGKSKSKVYTYNNNYDYDNILQTFKKHKYVKYSQTGEEFDRINDLDKFFISFYKPNEKKPQIICIEGGKYLSISNKDGDFKRYRVYNNIINMELLEKKIKKLN